MVMRYDGICASWTVGCKPHLQAHFLTLETEIQASSSVGTRPRTSNSFGARLASGARACEMWKLW
jgi:hypothetical protein